MKIVFSVILTALLVSSCSQRFNDKVVAIEKTHSYHRVDCPQVMMARASTVTRAEARKMNCQPCPNCKPDQQ